MTAPAPPSAWRLTRLALLAEGVGGVVWRAVGADGRTTVVKKLSRQAAPEASHALAWLRWRDGSGAIRLLGAQEDWQWLEDAGDSTLASVLEAEGDAAATRIAAEALSALHAPSDRQVEGLQTLEDRFEALRREARDQGGLFSEAASLAARLMSAEAPIRPLHGDLHHDNLLHGPRGWLAIDPHGLIGDPAYDAANLLYNPLERQDLRTDPERARRVAETLGPAVGRPAQAVLAWGFCHACLSAAWHLEDENHEEAARSLEVAQAIRLTLRD
ncbi:aminoglycoside phosphotransferase family protein [Brevundimonas naejangsanensis]|uniref:aminoglycoside phosphotransferase family protein n=1 Tax=Brevundimonas naejangsanensis TaxID=588932 RepID=UPI0026ED692B|nr:aminoglycoside phosphotransferase family protein [Brevundimonas naejangsanensis]